MRNVIMVNNYDVNGLKQGNNWEIQVTGPVTIVYEGGARGPYKNKKESKIKNNAGTLTPYQARKEKRAHMARNRVCPYCKARFINGAGLGSHIHKVHPGRPFPKKEKRS